MSRGKENTLYNRRIISNIAIFACLEFINIVMCMDGLTHNDSTVVNEVKVNNSSCKLFHDRLLAKEAHDINEITWEPNGVEQYW